MGYTAPVSRNLNITLKHLKGSSGNARYTAQTSLTFDSLAKEEHLMQIWPGRIKDLRKAKFLFVLYCICKYGCSVLKAVTRKGQKAMAIQIRAR